MSTFVGWSRIAALLTSVATAWAAVPLAAQSRPGEVHARGELNGAPFRIDIPEDWNGGLILWAHGYTPVFAHPRSLDVGAGPKVSAVANSLGFASAISWFSHGGLAFREGVMDTDALRSYFVQKYGPTEPTLIAGSHMGGFISFYMIERFPEVYDGAIAGTSNSQPSLMYLKDRGFDARLLYDYFFPGLPGSVVDFPAGEKTWKVVQEMVEEVVAEKPEEIARFCRLIQLRDPNRLGYVMGEYSEILRELQERAGGNAFDNRNTIYTGSDDDIELNQKIPRYAADAEAQEYVRQWFTPTGRLVRPMLAFHKMADAAVPVESTRYYDVLTQIAGSNDFFVQMYTARVEGASYNGPELRAALKLLLRWIKDGVRPQPGLLVPDAEYTDPGSSSPGTTTSGNGS